MKELFKSFGALMLMLLVSCVVNAQEDITAEWNFENDLPAGICAATNYQKVTADVPSTVEGITMHVDATNGKLYCVGRNNAQFNQGTILQIPVKSTRDIVTVKGYPGYVNYTIGGVAAEADLVEHKATTAEVAQGYVEVVGTGGSYLYGLKVVHVSAVQEKPLYSTTFTEWTDMEASTTETVIEKQTKYSHEALNFTLYDVKVGSTNFNTGKFPTWEGGMLMCSKSPDPYIITSPLASVTKVHFYEGATGSNRGWKLEAKGDGDADWVVVHSAVANPASGCEFTIDINRTNCQLRFTNLTTNQNAYLMQLDIYGMVDMSKTPMLGSFSVNGTKYQAADVFAEDANGNMVATIEIPKAQTMISDANPITDMVADNGDITGVVYETANNQTVATITVKAGEAEAKYIATFVFKPDFTLTYINTDGSVIGTQKVEKDAAITSFDKTVADVTVADGKAFRGWFVEAKGGRKYFVEDVVTEDINLYAVQTDIETASEDARYTFNLADRYFYDEDHEAFNATGAAFHDTQHGWTINPGDKIELLSGTHSYIIFSLCKYAADGAQLTLKDAAGNQVGAVTAKVNNDGQTASIEYQGEGGTLTLEATGQAYIHNITIANVGSNPIEPNEQGWYVVRPGDAGHLLTTLELAQAASNGTDRTYIFIPDGTYDFGNKVLTPISANNVSLIGQSMDNTIIQNTPEAEGIGITATFLITGNGTYMQDLTLKNCWDYYQPGTAGRAVCIQDKGNHTICKNVRMLSYQDTYYSNNSSQNLYWETSDIHGTVDFICGGGMVYFNQCTLTVEPRSADGSGECTITAPYTEGTKFGYIFNNCTIDSKAERFNYGRAWGGTPRCAYLNTTLLQPSKLNTNRWTAGGMNTYADSFVEYNTMDADGNVISPASHVMKFYKNDKNNEMETILTADQAAAYALDQVFASWTPAQYTVQADVKAVSAADGTITWDAVDGAGSYAVFKNGQLVAFTATTSYAFTEGVADDYTVRAANQMGGLGAACGSSTGIQGAGVDGATVVSSRFYNMQGIQVEPSYKGAVIRVAHSQQWQHGYQQDG